MLEGIVRESTGKKGTNALRRDGYLIANIYGKGLENIHAAFKMNEYIRAVRNKETLAFPITVGGKEMNVVVQSYEAQPLTSALLHVDLMVAQSGLEARYNVPVVAIGESIGVKNKGLLHMAKPRITVKCSIENLPNSIEVDVTDMDINDSKLIRDLDDIANVTILDADRVAVISIIKAK